MYKKMVKRRLDVLFSGVLLIVGAIPMAVIAVLVATTSKGPVFFKQERFGLNSKKFVIYKFRTMYIEAPVVSNQEFSDIHNYLTPLGSFLRKTSLDELPQLWNVFIGDMSFVGPRPLAETDYDVIKLRQQTGADRVRPGITGLAQVNGRNRISDNQKAAYDDEYAKNLTFAMEFKVVFKTFFSVAQQEGINKS
jgi:O-antigen biosynthesis protein WbqP